MNNDELIKWIDREIFKPKIKYIDNPINITELANNVDYIAQEIEKINKKIDDYFWRIK